MPRLSALEYALKLLGYRARTTRELREKLGSHKYDPESIDAVILRLEKNGLLDDELFAQNFTRDKLVIYRWGPRRIYWELIRRGVAREVADNATKEIGLSQELESARTLLAARTKQWAALDPVAKYRRAIGLLSRRGFSPSVTKSLLRDWRKY